MLREKGKTIWKRIIITILRLKIKRIKITNPIKIIIVLRLKFKRIKITKPIKIIIVLDLINKKRIK